MPLPEEEKNFRTKSELLDQVTALLGGRVSESIFLDDISTGAQNDLERATKIVRAMITEYGMSEELGPLTLGQKHDEQVFLGRDISRSRNFSEEVAAKIDKELNIYIENCYEKAYKLLSKNEDTVEKIVYELKERETLDSSQIQKLIAGESLPEPEEEEQEDQEGKQPDEQDDELDQKAAVSDSEEGSKSDSGKTQEDDELETDSSAENEAEQETENEKESRSDISAAKDDTNENEDSSVTEDYK